MNAEKIAKVQKLNAEIDNFKNAYEGGESLWGDQDGHVSAESLLAFLIENPHLQEMAATVDKLDR